MPRQTRKRVATDGEAVAAPGPKKSRTATPPPVAAAEPDDANDASIIDALGGFRLNCHAALFTWNTPDETSAAEALELLKALPCWGLVDKYTICAEMESHWHIHAYLEFHKRIDHSSAGWKIREIAPNVQPNRTKGSGYSQAVRRGSFYVANEFKKSFRSHVMNFFPGGSDDGGASYSVKTQWVIDQWSQNKLRDPLECAGRYKCCTGPFEKLVQTSNVQAAPKFVLPIDTYEPWQQELIEVLNEPADYRTIWWIWEPFGNIGKTKLMKHIESTRKDLKVLPLLGKAQDMMNGVVEYRKSTGSFPDVIFVPLPRAFNPDFLSYSGLEAVKDMFFYSGKFAGGVVNGRQPHMMVFANWPPPASEEFSADRWMVRKIVNGNLVDEAAAALTAEDEAASDAALAAALAAALPAAWPIFTAPTVRTEVASSSSSAPMFIFEE